MSILKEKKSGSGIGIDARVEVVDKLQEHSGKVSGWRTARARPASGTQIPAPCRRTERPVPP